VLHDGGDAALCWYFFSFDYGSKQENISEKSKSQIEIFNKNVNISFYKLL
jgi:hypothetical protein